MKNTTNNNVLVLVIARHNKWAVKRTEAKRAIKIYTHREEAYHHARTISNYVSVHKRDGSVEFIYGSP